MKIVTGLGAPEDKRVGDDVAVTPATHLAVGVVTDPGVTFGLTKAPHDPPTPSAITPGKTVENTPVGALKKLAKVTRGAGADRVFAALDLGSSSVKLLVMAQGPDGKLSVLEDARVGANLGKGIEPNGNLASASQDRVVEGLGTLLAKAATHGIEPSDIPLIATAAVRNAPNGPAFMKRIQDEVGLTRARILTGDEEAQTGYRAALLGLERRDPGNYATLDLGGGSFQLAVGTESKWEAGKSRQVGSNRVQEELLPTGIITKADYAKADAKLVEIAEMPLPQSQLEGRRFVAMGGVSLFLKAQFERDPIALDEIEGLRQKMGAYAPADRAEMLLTGVDAEKRESLGVHTPEGALDFATKLPAKLTLLLHIMRSIGLSELHVSSTDARHLLIEEDRTRKPDLQAP